MSITQFFYSKEYQLVAQETNLLLEEGYLFSGGYKCASMQNVVKSASYPENVSELIYFHPR